MTAFRVNPADSKVTPVSVDSAARSRAGLTVTGSQRTADGWQLFASRFEKQPVGPVANPDVRTATLSATLDRVTFQSEWAGSGSTCTTNDTAFQLRRRLPASEAGLPLDANADISLVGITLRDGAETSLALPPISTAFGGANVSLGCTPDTAFVSTVIGDPQAPVAAVYRLASDGAWQEVSELVPASALRPGDMVSDYGGVLIPWQIGRAEEGKEATAVVPETEPSSLLSQGPGDIWRGSTGERLKLNFPSESASTEPDIQFIQVWSR